MKQQTAIEWLKGHLEDFGDPQICEIKWEDLDLLVEQAKKIEKAQIFHAWENGALPDLYKEFNNSRTYYQNNYEQ